MSCLLLRAAIVKREREKMESQFYEIMGFRTHVHIFITNTCVDIVFPKIKRTS